MSVLVQQAGLATTIQDCGRPGWRHMGVPLSGAADPLSLALANRLVGNSISAPALEISLFGGTYIWERNTVIGLAGGASEISLNEQPVLLHQRININSGDVLKVAQVTRGIRLYLAVAGGFGGQEVFGSVATYAPAKLGGLAGRILEKADSLRYKAASEDNLVETPADLRPYMSDGWILRVMAGSEFEQLSVGSRARLLTEPFTASQRANRMGIELCGEQLQLTGQSIESAPVFPGTVQCPPEGNPFLLMADAQTTGGYPRIAQVIRADRHLMGQIRPEDTVRFLPVSQAEARGILKQKTALYNPWLNGCPFV